MLCDDPLIVLDGVIGELGPIPTHRQTRIIQLEDEPRGPGRVCGLHIEVAGPAKDRVMPWLTRAATP
jgi:hypothetical protein